MLRQWRAQLWIGGAVAAIALALYAQTLAPSITWRFGGADSGDLVSAADVFGIPHPTGYPLFILLGHLATRVPFGEVAGRINAMNALLAALGAGCLAMAVLSVPGFNAGRAQRVAAGLCAIGAATSALYWSQAIIGEVHALQALLITFVVFAWARAGTHPALRGIAHGLALCNHATSVLLLVSAVAVYGHRLLRSRRHGAAFAVGVAMPLALYALLPWRAAAAPDANWGNPDTLPRLWAHVTAQQYGSLLQHDVGAAVRDGLTLARLAAGDLPPWMLPSAAVGMRWLWRASRDLAAFTMVAAALTFAFAAAYRTPDRAPYLLAAYVVIALWSGLGLAAVLGWAADVGGRAGARVLPAAAVAMVTFMTVAWAVRTHAKVDLRGDDAAVVFARATLAALPEGAVYYSARDDVTFSLWYAQRSLHLRRDVQVIDIRNPALRGVR